MAKKDREDGPWTLTDALAEAFVLGFDTSADDAHKNADEALDDDDIAARLTRIHEKMGNELLGMMEAIVDLDEEEEAEVEEKDKDR